MALNLMEPDIMSFQRVKQRLSVNRVEAVGHCYAEKCSRNVFVAGFSNKANVKLARE